CAKMRKNLCRKSYSGMRYEKGGFCIMKRFGRKLPTLCIGAGLCAVLLTGCGSGDEGQDVPVDTQVSAEVQSSETQSSEETESSEATKPAHSPEEIGEIMSFDL